MTEVDMDRTLKERIEQAVREEIKIVPYDPNWPKLFATEAAFLQRRFPKSLLRRIEHFGSTAVPGLAAKPVVDMLLEVSCLNETVQQVVPVLTAAGYDYFWRPAFDGSSEHYAWFIKRNAANMRTHHLHFVEHDSGLWDRLYFRDYLIKFPALAEEYTQLKIELANQFPNDRVAYTNGKTEFIVKITQQAIAYFKKM